MGDLIQALGGLGEGWGVRIQTHHMDSWQAGQAMDVPPLAAAKVQNPRAGLQPKSRQTQGQHRPATASLRACS